MGTKKSAVLYAGVVSWQYKSERWTKHQQLFYEYKIPGLNPTAFIFLYRLTLRLPEDFDPFKACTCYFWFSLQMVTHQNYEKCFLFHLKSPIHSRNIQIFVIFSLPFHTLQIQKDKWNRNNLKCRELACIN